MLLYYEEEEGKPVGHDVTLADAENKVTYNSWS